MAFKDKTAIELFYELESTKSNEIFLRQPFGNTWEEYTYKETGDKIRRLVTYLHSLDLPKHSNIGLISKNCREWIIADLAIIMAGHVSVPLYATLKEDTLSEVLRIGDVAALFVGKLEDWDGMKNGVASDIHVIKFPQYKGAAILDRGVEWNDIMSDYEPTQHNYIPSDDDLWTIVFTSGTTGTPKGVMHSHRMLKNAGRHTGDFNVLKMDENGHNRLFSYLPLNHIAERMAVEAQGLTYGGSISFPESLETFAQNLRDTKPTMFFGVPRIYTKFQLGILASLPQKKLSRLLKIPFISSIIKKKIRKGLGLEAAKVMLVGAAPMSKQDKLWWKNLGMPISEGYGMTENLGVATFLDGAVNRPGSIGKFYPENDVRVDPESGEIQVRSAWNMLGYYKNKEKTDEVLQNGWLHTGDQGRIDEDGYVYLTGRVKDTFKTAKGQYIVPGPLEFKFANNKDIEQICVCGLGLPQPIAIVVPSEIGHAKSKEELENSLSDTLLKANSDLPGYKRISHVMVAKDPWGVENNLLTPTLKIKRTEVDNKYLESLNQVCQCEDPIYWE